MVLTSVTMFPVPPTAAAGGGPPASEVTDHGLFVAGLTNGVAPNSEIHLHRVLNEHGIGDLARLIEAVDGFIGQQTPTHTVTINLSLGVRHPDFPTNPGLPKEVPLLSTTLKAPHVVVVAAAGNDSAGLSAPHPTMRLPARYSFVIGVAASDSQNGPACFSNAGDVAAPGGQGFSAPGGPSAGSPASAFPAQCQPRNNQCQSGSGGPGQPECLISRVHGSSGPGTSGFAFWSGTSFATPLVSGLAALLLEAGVPPGDVASRIETRACPSASPSFAKIINVRRALMDPPPACPP